MTRAELAAAVAALRPGDVVTTDRGAVHCTCCTAVRCYAVTGLEPPLVDYWLSREVLRELYGRHGWPRRLAAAAFTGEDLPSV